ncbi:MAG: hypothetical protein M3Q70_03615 [bacterium]|nr:hypothetical protein [bacterium]
MRESKMPYEQIGRKLKFFREQARESLEEVSGAVEIATDELAKIERGEVRPTEDILDLLISHFSLADHEEDRLWELAGYSKLGQEGQNHTMTALMMLPYDSRIVYSDMAQVSVNNFGVVMNFMQVGGAGGKQPLAIARIGMSREHAQSVLQLLQQSLNAEPESPKLLDNPDNKK